MESYNFGKLVSNLRKAKGMTQAQLAEKLFITDKAVSKWERNLSFPDISLLKSLAEIFDVSVSYLLGIEEKDENDKNYEQQLNLRLKEKIEKYEKRKKEKLKIIIIELILATIFIGILVYIGVSYYFTYHLSKIEEGDNLYSIGYYDLEKYGLDNLEYIVENSQNMSEKYTVAFFEARLDRKGIIKSFTLTLNRYNSKEEYLGTLGYTYNNKKLSYNSSTNSNMYIVKEYDKNSEIQNISNYIKKIPIKEQINLCSLKNYILVYSQNTTIEKDVPIIDMRVEGSKALTLKDYKDGVGGKSDDDDVIAITLRDYSQNEEKYIYVFERTYKNEKVTNSYLMETDYYIDVYDRLRFTRDYGKNWIYTDLTEKEVTDTLDFYNSLSLLDNSWFISTDKYLPIAFFYGIDAKLKISYDDGNSWESIKVADGKDFGKMKITKRVVGVTSKNVIYAALGTDYSSSFGEYKKMYISTDYGKTFVKKELPEEGTPSMLIDLCMYDEKNGVLILENSEDINMPLIYATKDGGASFQQIKFSYFNLPDEIKYLVDVDSITKDVDDYYIITLGQASLGSLKVEFKTRDLQGMWSYSKMYRKTIHLVG